MDQGVSRKLSTRTPSVSRVLFEMQRNIFELLDRASFLLRNAARCFHECSPEEDALMVQSLLDIEECLLAVQSLLPFWEEEMRRTLGKGRLSEKKETVLNRL